MHFTLPAPVVPFRRVTLLGAFASLPLALAAQSVDFHGSTFTSHGLVGVGRLAANTLDEFGETFGSFSAFTLDLSAWSYAAETGSYTGTLYTQPDRGYNGAGTTNYTPRYNVIDFTFTPTPAGAPTQDQVALTLRDTVKFTEPGGTPLTSIDPPGSGTGTRAYLAALPLPEAYNGRLSLDAEGIVRLGDGSLFVSDEYGPYIYRFAADGTLTSVITPPAALLPQRNGSTSFASNNPQVGQPAPSPVNPVTGRQNNQGLEGLTLTPDGKHLVALLQSAARQDLASGNVAGTRRNTRLLVYDIATDPANPTLVAEHAVQLPTYTETGGTNPTRVAAQSELIALNDNQFLVLARDGRGHGLASFTSDFRQIVLLDTTGATNLAGTDYDALAGAIAPNGVLDPSITPVDLGSFLDLNDAVQLAKFGLHNGGVDDANNLSEKWEALALAPDLATAATDDYFLFVGNDNDFITGTGFQDGASYNAGFENDSMILVYRVTLPTALIGLTPIPEPSTWAAFAGVFALAGALLRRRARPASLRR